MPASLTPVRIRVIAVLVILGFGGLGVALASGGDSPRRRVTVATSTSAHETTTTRATVTTVAPTTTTAPTTTAAPTTSTATVPAPATTPPTAPPPAPVVNTALGSLRGRTIAIDPGHDGGNYAHASEIGRPIFIGTQSRACDTTGTQTNDGYTEAAYNLDVALRLRDAAAGRGRERRDDARDQRRLGTVHRRTRAIGNRAARRRGDLDSRRRWTGRRPRLPRADAGARCRIHRRHLFGVARARRRRARRVPRDGHADVDVLRERRARGAHAISAASTSRTFPRCSWKPGTCATPPTPPCSRAPSFASAKPRRWPRGWIASSRRDRGSGLTLGVSRRRRSTTTGDIPTSPGRSRSEDPRPRSA